MKDFETKRMKLGGKWVDVIVPRPLTPEQRKKEIKKLKNLFRKAFAS